MVTLLKEVHHRMKNNMATLVGLFTLQADRSDNESVKAALAQASSRATAMMVLYEELFAQEYQNPLIVAEFLPRLTREVVRLFDCCYDVSFRFNVGPGTLAPSQTQPVTLIVNELVTNAMKYAFVQNPDPELAVSFSCHQGICTLVVADNGPGAPEGATFAPGFGLELLNVLTRQLQGHAQVDCRAGTRVTVTFPQKLFAEESGG